MLPAGVCHGCRRQHPVSGIFKIEVFSNYIERAMNHELLFTSGLLMEKEVAWHWWQLPHCLVPSCQLWFNKEYLYSLAGCLLLCFSYPVLKGSLCILGQKKMVQLLLCCTETSQDYSLRRKCIY